MAIICLFILIFSTNPVSPKLIYILQTVVIYRLAGVAQLVERVTRNHQVEGSNPSAGLMELELENLLGFAENVGKEIYVFAMNYFYFLVIVVILILAIYTAKN